MARPSAPEARAKSRLRSWAYALRTTNPPPDGPVDAITRWLVVTRAGESDVMTLKAECASPSESLQSEIAATLRAVAKLGGSVELVGAGSLPNDGKVIADER